MISELDIYQIIISWRLISRFRARRRGPESLDREPGQVAVILRTAAASGLATRAARRVQRGQTEILYWTNYRPFFPI